MLQSPTDLQRQQQANFQKIYQCYRTLISVNVSEYESSKTRLVFPKVPLFIFSSLCSAAAKIFIEEPTVLQISSDTEALKELVIIGDLHGHILDLFRILKIFGLPPKSRYLFLGDMVDRGEFSTETTILVLLLKVLFPSHVFIIRGNHEFSTMWRSNGFITELTNLYRNDLTRSNNKYNINIINDLTKMFDTIPLAAVIDNKIACVHGGIGPHFTKIHMLTDVIRPITEFDVEPLLSAVWSDPSENVDEYHPSSRGSGFFFGKKAVDSFLDGQKFDLLVRGHQSISDGIHYNLDGRCVTVFSASNYCGQAPNMAGVLVVGKLDKKSDTISDTKSDQVTNNDKNYLKEEIRYYGQNESKYYTKAIIFPAIAYLQREMATFLLSTSEKNFTIGKITFTPPPSSSLGKPIPAINTNLNNQGNSPCSPISGFPQQGQLNSPNRQNSNVNMGPPLPPINKTCNPGVLTSPIKQSKRNASARAMNHNFQSHAPSNSSLTKSGTSHISDQSFANLNCRSRHLIGLPDLSGISPISRSTPLIKGKSDEKPDSKFKEIKANPKNHPSSPLIGHHDKPIYEVVSSVGQRKASPRSRRKPGIF
ncbi:protein phosphatase-2B [Tritrichomonas foetus]|uniref:Serine/threonine-protein phosphatase n=1 Tax=Tritrichomonas foetus TaxID=1144522 RepID=A0A1J4K502_9EUKA|nr:protein phosphatase-2B [Tritrichomonas foetus]|eukprot:OHT04581.1 protein phosphatase-2B [Tritrichomonas foetus]